MTRRSLRDDRRGVVALAPVFIILAVLLLATIASTVMFSQSIVASTSKRLSDTAASRSAVAALAAELNTRPLPDISAQAAAAGMFIPESWIPGADQTIDVTSVTGVDADTVHARFTVTAGTTRTYTVEFTHLPVALTNGQWVQVTPPQVPEHSVWTAVRTIQETP